MAAQSQRAAAGAWQPRPFDQAVCVQAGQAGTHLMVRLMDDGVKGICTAACSARGVLVLSSMPLDELPKEPLMFFCEPLFSPRVAGLGDSVPDDNGGLRACLRRRKPLLGRNAKKATMAAAAAQNVGSHGRDPGLGRPQRAPVVQPCW